MNPRKRKLAARSGQLALVAAGALVLATLAAGFGGSTARKSAPGTPEPSPALSFDANILLKQFQAAQRKEMNGLFSRERKAAKALRATQGAEQKDFDRREREARRKFFAADPPGAEKRAYMKDLLARRAALRKRMADERAQARSGSGERIQALRDEQQSKLRKFRDELRQNQRPDDALWPQPTLETD